MDKYNGQTWVGNMYQKFEAVCQEVDDLVNKDAVKYVENHMQTVGESVKKFYSGVVQDIQHVTQSIPSKQIDLVETCTSSVVVKENTIDNDTNKSVESPSIPTEKCHKSSTTGLCHSEQISCAISGDHVGEADANSYFQLESDNLMNKTSDKAIHVHRNSSTSSHENFEVEQFLIKNLSSPKHKNSAEAFINSGCIDEMRDDDHSAKISHESSENHLDNKSFEEEGILFYPSSESDASVFEDADWDIESIIDLNLGIDKKIEGEPSSHPTETLVNDLKISCSQEKETLISKIIDEFESDSNSSTLHQSSKPESSITCNENKEEKACNIIAGGLSNSSFRNSPVDPDTVYCKSSESVGRFSVSSHSLSSCESFGALGSDSNNDSTRLASSSYSLFDDTTRSDEAVSITRLCRREHGRCSNYAECEATVSFSEIGAADGSTVDVQDLNMDTIDLSDKPHLVQSCDIVEGEEPFAFPYRSRRSKSYKKIIQDAFTSRKRLTKEYKQLAIWYGDIEKEFSQPTEKNAPKSPGQGLDSEWELL